MRTEDQGTYEMQWDCEACGTAKLLGLTHRFCPACGSPQDPEGRYFPSDENKIAVENHQLVGRDRACPACDTPNANEANNCMGCGCPLDEAKEVDLRQDVVTADGASFGGESGADAKAVKREKRAQVVAAAQKQPEPEKKSGKGKWVAGGGALAGVAALLMMSSPVDLEVQGHSWERTIEVQEFGPTRDGSWCSSRPSDAYNLSRSRKVKSHKKVPDGEECKTRRVDNGNGSYSQKRECRTKYKKEPVYAAWCDYTVDRWHRDRVEEASGKGLDPIPAWPKVTLVRTGDCIGCEREGSRSESYTVQFLDQESESHDCDFGQEKWADFTVGSKWAGEVGVVAGLDCDEVRAPGRD
jgi:hypothetical protein